MRRSVPLSLAGSAALLLAAASAQPAAAEPSGVSAHDLVRAGIDRSPATSAAAPADVATLRVEFAPGTGSPWHSHPGAGFVAIGSGEVTYYRAGGGGCTSSTHGAGDGFYSPAGEVQLVRNEGKVPAVLYVTFAGVPKGGALEAEEDRPSGSSCPAAAAGGHEEEEEEAHAEEAGHEKEAGHDEASGRGEEHAHGDLGRATLADPLEIAAAKASDMAVQTYALAGGSSAGWHEHAGTALVVVRKGTVTLTRAGAAGCSTATYAAGRGYALPAGTAHLLRNAGGSRAELTVTHVSVPAGSELERHADAPTGGGCAAVAALPHTGPGGTAALAAAGIFLVTAGAALRRRPAIR